MSRPTLSICTRCTLKKKRDDGADLYERVRELRRERELKELFKVDEVHCLGLCDTPCAIQLEGKKRSTYSRVKLAPEDAEALVAAAIAYAHLAPGQELPERALPGEHAD